MNYPGTCNITFQKYLSYLGDCRKRLANIILFHLINENYKKK